MLYFPPWKRVLIIGICLLGLVVAMPNLFYETVDESTRAEARIDQLERNGEPVPDELREAADQWPGWLPGDVVNLGLDLRGGAHLLVEVQVQEVVAERMQQLRGDVREALIGAEVRRFTELRATEDHVSVTISNPEEVERARQALEDLARPVDGGFGGGGFGVGGAVGGGQDLAVELTDDRTLRLSLTEPAVAALTDRTVTQSLEIIRRRVDEAGTREPTIQRQGEDRVLVQVPGVGSADEVLSLIGRTAKLTFHEVNAVDSQKMSAGPGEMALPGHEDDSFYLLERRPVLSGERLTEASLGFHPENGLPVVNFGFDTAGARIFGNYTAANVGNLFAIVLDEEVISAPRIQSPILGGSGFIEGNFTTESATELAILLRSGALPASIEVLEQRTVGPDLGADSIQKGSWASLIALAAVVLFIGGYYGRFGLYANIALALNIALIFAALSAIGATLTLPGIAGIVLTIGMAVDANVLIFERIREELKTSKGIARAVERGYEQALSAIVDANVTTLIAAVILFGMGSGPVKGFAVTLGLGILTSLFTAIWVTRLIIALWVHRTRPKEVTWGWVPMVAEATSFNFMRWRRPWAMFSGGTIVASILLVAVMGLNFGIDFRGGTLVEVRTEEPADLARIRQIVGGMNLGEVQVQDFGSARDVLIRVQEQGGSGDEQTEVASEIGERLTAEVPGTDINRVEVVGPKVSAELLQAGVIAILLAIVAISIYIWLRFEWQFGAGAVLALVHDVAITMGIFALLQIEFNLSIIAALLTIVGYSLNDTVVIYDRIRENLRKYKKMPLIELLDLSVNETMSRTIMTSGTTLMALIAMFFLGPEVIKGFTFAMIWGILVGTYSSVFVAAPLLMWFNVKRDWTTDEEKKAGVQFGGAQV